MPFRGTVGWGRVSSASRAVCITPVRLCCYQKRLVFHSRVRKTRQSGRQVRAPLSFTGLREHRRTRGKGRLSAKGVPDSSSVRASPQHGPRGERSRVRQRARALTRLAQLSVPHHHARRQIGTPGFQSPATACNDWIPVCVALPSRAITCWACGADQGAACPGVAGGG